MVILSLAGVAIATNPIKLFIDSKEIKPDVPPKIINGRTLVPIRVIVENFGADVNWDGKNVEIESKESKFIKWMCNNRQKRNAVLYVNSLFSLIHNERLWTPEHVSDYLSNRALYDQYQTRVQIFPIKPLTVIAGSPTEAPIEWDIQDVKLKPDGSYDVYIKYLTVVDPGTSSTTKEFCRKNKSYLPGASGSFYKWYYGVATVIFEDKYTPKIDKFTIIN